jgi:sec-independent protein translocase protein TatA
MGSLGAWEILLIALVILLVFGAKRIPELARGLGKGIREFKDATNDIKQEFDVNRPEPPRQFGPPAQPYAPPAQQPTAHQAPPAAPEPPAVSSEPPPAQQA